MSQCDSHSFLLLHLFLAVGGSFVSGFPLPGGILVFTASTHFASSLEWQSEICFTVLAVGMPPLWVQFWYFRSSMFYCLTSSGLRVCVGPSMIRTVPGACCLRSFELHSPWCTPLWQCQAAGRVERRLEVLLQENSPKFPRVSFCF